ncbi:hypothetical protein FGO68_gene2867 [Halteria grandinella]|uniref:Uncharacterized protein n=1 Tax=Halteria grandinella TaxID=5974 RepID=A0A8J8T6F4_HALGN|nr:hypothetical protein FGO68_gene2867 [Halteria grandinella]
MLQSLLYFDKYYTYLLLLLCASILFMTVISAFSVFCNFFFIFLQTYTFIIEAVVHAIAIGFVAMECLIGALCVLFFFQEAPTGLKK